MTIQFPVDALTYCSELDLSEDELNARLKNPKDVCKEVNFALDIPRISSAEQLKEVFASSSSLKAYKEDEISQGKVYVGTLFEHKGVKAPALVCVNVKDVAKCVLTVRGDKPQFIESVIKAIVDAVSK